MERKEIIYGLCIMLSVMSLIISNVTASKMYDIELLGLNIVVPIGTSLFCLSFLATDVISEIWGRQHAIFVAILGLIARLFTAGFFLIAISIEGLDTYVNQEAYQTILGSSSRILIGGIVGYTTSAIIDAYIFHYFREKHKGRNLLFLRNNISTFFAYTLGAALFVSISFYGTVPNSVLFQIFTGNLMIKWLFALLDTPLVYIIRNIALKRRLFDFKG